MKNISNKNVLSIVFVSLLLAAGVFFGGSNAHASSRSVRVMDCELTALITPASVDCDDSAEPATNTFADCSMSNQVAQKDGSTGNALMPCCLERQDNSAIAVSPILRDGTNFSQFAIVKDEVPALLAAEQKTYLASKSPPNKADILSSIVKIE